MDLSDYFRALRLHWLGALLIVAAVTTSAVVFSLLQPKVYAATSTGFVGTGLNDIAGVGVENDQLAKSRATSYVDIAAGRGTAQGAIEQLGLHTTPEALIKRIEVVQPHDTVLIRITARASSPGGARALADAWVDSLADQVRDIEAPGKSKVPNGTPRIIRVEQAELPTSPAEPQPVRNALLAILVGALLAWIYAVISTKLDHRVRGREEIHDRFEVPVLGIIPNSRAVRSRSVGPGVDLAVDEAYRALRANLLSLDGHQPVRALMIVSPRPGDGKSTVARHIATSLARGGQRVALVDADLRRPSLAGLLGVSADIGLSSVVTGKEALADAIQEVEGEPGLRVLTAGPVPPNPGELLGTPEMKGVIDELARESLVIIDSPPLLTVADGLTLADMVGGSVVVAAAGRTRDADVDLALSNLGTVGGRAVGVVLNRAKVQRPSRKDRAYYDAYLAHMGQPRRRGLWKGRRGERRAN